MKYIEGYTYDEFMEYAREKFDDHNMRFVELYIDGYITDDELKESLYNSTMDYIDSMDNLKKRGIYD